MDSVNGRTLQLTYATEASGATGSLIIAITIAEKTIPITI